jgi:hypothetical protein
MGIYGRDLDNEDDGNLSYNSSDGSDKDDSDVNLSLGDGAEGTSPTATTGNTAEQSPLRRQMDDIPDWLQEMIDNQAYRISHLLSAPITKCSPCIACNNHIDVTDPRGWICAFLQKSGATAWEVFDKILRKLVLTWIGTAMMASGTCGTSITGARTLHISNLSRQQGMQPFGFP